MEKPTNGYRSSTLVLDPELKAKIKPSVNYKPLNKFLLLEPDPAETTREGIIIPEKSRRSPFSGICVARADDANPALTIGTRVYFGQVGCGNLEVNKKMYIMLADQSAIAYDAPLDVEGGLRGDVSSATLAVESASASVLRHPVQSQPN